MLTDNDWCCLKFILIDTDWCWLVLIGFLSMLINFNWCWLVLIYADWCWFICWMICWLLLTDADWCWLILIGTYRCWLILIDADWCWLMLIVAQKSFNQVFFCRCVPLELLWWFLALVWKDLFMWWCAVIDPHAGRHILRFSLRALGSGPLALDSGHNLHKHTLGSL